MQRTILATAALVATEKSHIRKKSSRWTWLTPAEHNTANAKILALPGEIRNHIYSLTVFPRLAHLTIVPGTGLHLPSIFCVCKQFRAEAMSFLCANNEVRALGIGAACRFFKNMGIAVANVKRIVLAQPMARGEPLEGKVVDEFFGFLDQAKELRYFKLEIGAVDRSEKEEREEKGIDVVFLERVREFVKEKEKDGMVFEWCAGAYDPSADAQESAAEKAVWVRSVLGEEGEVAVSGAKTQVDGLMMW
jgi:hypothetical protein